MQIALALTSAHVHIFSLIFFHPTVGEFWYDLRLKADPPPKTTLPHMECDLGRWVLLLKERCPYIAI